MKLLLKKFCTFDELIKVKHRSDDCESEEVISSTFFCGDTCMKYAKMYQNSSSMDIIYMGDKNINKWELGNFGKENK